MFFFPFWDSNAVFIYEHVSLKSGIFFSCHQENVINCKGDTFD